MFMGKGEEARATLAQLEATARNNGERRQAHFWEAASYVGEGDTAKALGALGKMAALADQDHDLAVKSGDVNLIGQVLLHAGKPDEAQAKFGESVRLLDGVDVPAGVKEGNWCNNLYFEARVALAKGDVKAVVAKAAAFRT